jgi:hypothetical protein
MNILVQQNSMVPLRETNYAARRRRIQENFLESQQSILSESVSIIEQKEADATNTSKRLADHFGSSSKKREQRKAFVEQMSRNYQFVENMLIESLCEMFYESIILDESFKDQFSESILAAGEEFFKESFNHNIINLKSFSESDSLTMRQLYRVCEHTLACITEDAEQNEAILEAAKAKRKESVDKVADAVKTKVAKVVKNEKEIADANKEHLESLKVQEHVIQRREVPSLFKSIMVSNSRNPLSESGSESNTVDMKMVFAESIIQYTLLEMMNTTKLLNLNARQTQKLAFDFQFAK